MTPDELASARQDGRDGPGPRDDGRRSTAVETSRGTWSAAQFSFGEMLARASADVRLRPGDLVGSGTVGGGCLLEIREETLGRYLEPGDEVILRDRAPGGAADADRGEARMTAVDRAPVAVAPATARPGSIRRVSSSTSTSSPPTPGGWPRERLPAASRSGRTSRPTRASRLARLQLDAGAVGVTVGTIGEAEAMVDGGILDVFIGYPVWAEGPKAARLRALHDRSSLTVGVDSAEAAAAACRGGRRVAGWPAPRRSSRWISGARRSGVAGPAEALAVARRARESGLDVDRRLHPRRPRLPRARRRSVGGRRRGRPFSAPPPTRFAPTGSPSSACQRRLDARPASMRRPARSTRSGPGRTSSATASSSSSARSRPTASRSPSRRPSSRSRSTARSSSTPAPRR